MAARIKVDFESLSLALMATGSDVTIGEAYVDRRTGEVHVPADDPDFSDVTEEMAESDDYIAVPSKL